MARKAEASSKARRKRVAEEPAGDRGLGRKMTGGSLAGASGALRLRAEDASPRLVKKGKAGAKSPLVPSGRPSGRRR